VLDLSQILPGLSARGSGISPKPIRPEVRNMRIQARKPEILDLGI